MKTIKLTLKEAKQIQDKIKTMTSRPIKSIPDGYELKWIEKRNASYLSCINKIGQPHCMRMTRDIYPKYEDGQILQIPDTDIKIKVVGVKAIQLNDIQIEDYIKEGYTQKGSYVCLRPQSWESIKSVKFKEDWDSFYAEVENGKYLSKNNPWTWQYEFVYEEDK